MIMWKFWDLTRADMKLWPTFGLFVRHWGCRRLDSHIILIEYLAQQSEYFQSLNALWLTWYGVEFNASLWYLSYELKKQSCQVKSNIWLGRSVHCKDIWKSCLKHHTWCRVVTRCRVVTYLVSAQLSRQQICLRSCTLHRYGKSPF